jgi:hypothetical protein
MPKDGTPLQVFRGTTIDAVNNILRENKTRLEALQPSERLAKLAQPKSEYALYGPGHYFTTEKSIAKEYADDYERDHGPSTVLSGELTDKSPLLIPTRLGLDLAPAGTQGVVHPDEELRARALKAFDDHRAHMEQRIRSRFESTAMEPREKAHFIDQGLRGIDQRRSNLAAGDSIEIARLGGHMGYQSAVVHIGYDDNDGHPGAHVVAYRPEAVKITGSSAHFKAGQEAGK